MLPCRQRGETCFVVCASLSLSLRLSLSLYLHGRGRKLRATARAGRAGVAAGNETPAATNSSPRGQSCRLLSMNLPTPFQHSSNSLPTSFQRASNELPTSFQRASSLFQDYNNGMGNNPITLLERQIKYIQLLTDHAHHPLWVAAELVSLEGTKAFLLAEGGNYSAGQVEEMVRRADETHTRCTCDARRTAARAPWTACSHAFSQRWAMAPS